MLSRIVKDDAKRMALSFAKRAHPVPHCYSIDTATALDRPVVDGEDHRLSRFQRHDLDSRLHPRPLLGQDQFAARELCARLRQEECCLQRETQLAVQVLMQAIIVARSVAQDQRCRPGLSFSVALKDIFFKTAREIGSLSKRAAPLVGERNQSLI